MTTGDIESHMRELYDIDISDSTIRISSTPLFFNPFMIESQNLALSFSPTYIPSMTIETKKQTIVEMDIQAKPCTPVMEIWMWQSQGIVMGIMNLS